MKKLLTLIISVILISLIAFSVWYSGQNERLSEKPEAEESPYQVEELTSFAAVEAKIRLSAITEALNAADELKGIREKGREKLTKKKKIIWDEPAPIFPKDMFRTVRREKEITLFSQDVDYWIEANRSGPFQTSPIDGGLRITVPIKFNGQVGFTGDIAKVLSLDKKNFDGEIQGTIDIKLAIDENWTPQPNINISFDWKEKARIEIVGGLWIPIAKYIEKPLREELAKAGNGLRKEISSDLLRKEVEKVWRSHSIPVKESGAVIGYVNLTPKNAYLSSISSNSENVTFSVAAEASIAFSEEPIATGAIDLPPLKTTPNKGRETVVAVPVTLTYATIEELLLRKLKEEKFQIGNGSEVSILDFEIYPKMDRIVVGIQFSADLDGKVFDTTGWVYCVARPEVSSDQKTVSLTDVEFTRILNNDLWDLLTIVFEGQMKSLLESQASYSLAEDLAELEKQLHETLADPEFAAGAKISVLSSNSGIARIVPAKEELLIDALWKGTVSVEIYSASN